MVSSYSALVLSGYLRAGELCGAAARFKMPTDEVPQNVRQYLGSAVVRSIQKHMVAHSEACGRTSASIGRRAGFRASSSIEVTGDTLSTRALELLADIESASSQVQSTYELAGILTGIVSSAYSELPTDEADGVAGVASVALSSAEYWEGSLGPLLAAAGPWVQTNCSSISVEECMGGYDGGGCEPPHCWETSSPLNPPVDPSRKLFFVSAGLHDSILQLASGDVLTVSRADNWLGIGFRTNDCEDILPSTWQIFRVDAQVAGTALVAAKVAGPLTGQAILASAAAGGAASAIYGWFSIFAYLYCMFTT